MSANKPTKAASMIAAASGQWFSACLQPWSVLCTWNAYWGDQWREWLSEIGSAPNPWLPALAGDRHDQPVGIDFFLPWLPRVKAIVGSLDAVGEKDVQRVMLRAALPHVGSSSEATPPEIDDARAGEVRPRSTGKKSGGYARLDAGDKPPAASSGASPVGVVVKARKASMEKAAAGAMPAAKRKSAVPKLKKTTGAASAPGVQISGTSDATKQ